MPTILDNNNVVLFNDPIKLYLFKDTLIVKVSFKITDYVVINREFSQKDFEFILDNWQDDDGVQGNINDLDNNKIWWYYSKFGPRPESISGVSMVCINFNRYSFRFTLDEMKRVTENYYHQKTSKMHWDE